MFRHRFIFFFFFFVHLSQGTVWDFGEDHRSSKIIAHHTGQMNALKKIQYISITVPECMKLIYLKVEVDNPNTPPAVSFNKDTNMVTIYYKSSQDSRSLYDIVARGVRDKYCRRNSRVGRRKKGFKWTH